jgi:hypothetical protein
MFRMKTLRPAHRRSTIPVGLRVAAISLGWFAQAALATLPSSPDAPATASSTRPQKIRELVADLGYGADIKHVDAAVPYLTAHVAPNDPTWNSTHPRWRSVSALIGRNLRSDADAQFSETEAAFVENAVRAMSDGVVREDLDAALAFFRSPTGRRFLDLQQSLFNLSIEVSLERETVAGSPSVENLDARKRVLGLWLPLVFIRVMSGPETADRAMDGPYQSFSRLRARELDVLARQYAEDLPQSEQFLQSASFRRIVDAEEAAEHKTPEPDFTTFFAAEAKRHASEWQAAFRGP